MLTLKSVEIREKKGDVVMFNGKTNLKSFNLLVSDNAQGKTRFLNTINFLSKLAYNKARPLDTNFWSKWEFENASSSSTDNIIYEVRVKGQHDKNEYSENIFKNKKLIFSSLQNILIDEGKKSGQKNRIENFYLPVNTPAIVSITEPKFRTIGLIRGFFQRMVYISSNKTRDVQIDPNSLIPNAVGTNIGSVLSNWSTKYPDIFREVVNEFKNVYRFINDVYFTDQEPGEGLRAKLLTLKEQAVEEPVTQLNWSDGMYRMLFLIMAVKVPFIEGENINAPSLIMVDEIEDGLDYKSLKYIINYYEDYSDEFQFVLSSHSPLVCELIHPQNWIVVKRKGSEIRFVSPSETEHDLNNQLELYKQKHWDLYTKHISNSDIY